MGRIFRRESDTGRKSGVVARLEHDADHGTSAMLTPAEVQLTLDMIRDGLAARVALERYEVDRGRLARIYANMAAPKASYPVYYVEGYRDGACDALARLATMQQHPSAS